MTARHSRERMVDAAAKLFRRQGYHATAFSEITAESGAPRGSIYFHFPQGKEQMAAAATGLATLATRAGADYAAEQAIDAPGFVRAFGNLAGQELAASGYRDGCAIATLVLELAPQVEGVRVEAERSYAASCDALAAHFARFGYEYTRAKALGTLMMATLEGAYILCRAALSLDAMNTAFETLAGMLEDPGAADQGRSGTTHA